MIFGRLVWLTNRIIFYTFAIVIQISLKLVAAPGRRLAIRILILKRNLTAIRKNLTHVRAANNHPIRGRQTHLGFSVDLAFQTCNLLILLLVISNHNISCCNLVSVHQIILFILLLYVVYIIDMSLLLRGNISGILTWLSIWLLMNHYTYVWRLGLLIFILVVRTWCWINCWLAQLVVVSLCGICIGRTTENTRLCWRWQRVITLILLLNLAAMLILSNRLIIFMQWMFLGGILFRIGRSRIQITILLSFSLWKLEQCRLILTWSFYWFILIEGIRLNRWIMSRWIPISACSDLFFF